MWLAVRIRHTIAVVAEVHQFAEANWITLRQRLDGLLTAGAFGESEEANVAYGVAAIGFSLGRKQSFHCPTVFFAGILQLLTHVRQADAHGQCREDTVNLGAIATEVFTVHVAEMLDGRRVLWVQLFDEHASDVIA